MKNIYANVNNILNSYKQSDVGTPDNNLQKSLDLFASSKKKKSL